SAQHRDEVAEQIAPCRFAVEAKDDFAVLRTLVHIVHLEARSAAAARRKREGAATGRVRLHRHRPLWTRFQLETFHAMRLLRFQVKTTKLSATNRVQWSTER